MPNAILHLAAVYYAAWNIAASIGIFFTLIDGTPTHKQPWSEN